MLSAPGLARRGGESKGLRGISEQTRRSFATTTITTSTPKPTNTTTPHPIHFPYIELALWVHRCLCGRVASLVRLIQRQKVEGLSGLNGCAKGLWVENNNLETGEQDGGEESREALCLGCM